MSEQDDPFLRVLKDTAQDLEPGLPDELFSGDPAAQDQWLRAHGFPVPERSRPAAPAPQPQADGQHERGTAADSEHGKRPV
jgi:hypothetical protein